jgi:hypothetical protein
MRKAPTTLTTHQLGALIYEVRGHKVMLDFDLAKVHGVETKSLNRAVKRNADRFPKDFMFQISSREWETLKYQIGISSSGHGGRRRPPYAFTEHGAIMAANVLNSPRAVRDKYKRAETPLDRLHPSFGKRASDREGASQCVRCPRVFENAIAPSRLLKLRNISDFVILCKV